MNTSNADNEFQGFMENSEPVVPTETELGLLNLNLKAEVIRTGKIRELGIFTVGIGIIITLLTLWISFVAAPVPGRPIPLAVRP